MTLTLHEHPFASYCWKALIALYERDVAFEPQGVVQARAALDRAYELLDGHLAGGGWAAGPAFTLADCAAAPALFYARVVHRWDEERLAGLTRYFAAVTARPSVARVIDEAREYRIVGAVRTPIGRHRGALAAVRPDDLGALVLETVMERAGVPPSEVED